MTARYTWEEIRAQLVKLVAYIPPGETLELCVFGGSTVLCWGMQDRLSNDVDVLQSMSSPGLLEVAAAAAGAIRFRNVEDPEHMSLVDELEQKRQIDAESEEQEEEGRGARFKVWGTFHHMRNSTVEPDIDPV